MIELDVEREFSWELRGGIMVSVPRRVDPPPAPKWETVHDLIACPTCRARVDEPCRTKSGHKREPHLNRLVSRRCPCGGTVEGACIYCPPCRRRRDQAAKNDYGRRRRQADRARYA